MRGLVLEGGGVKGSYQIGSYMAFRKCHIPFDGYVGTSIGSFNACMLACNQYRVLLDFWEHVNPGDLFDFDERFVKAIKNKEIDKKSLVGAVSTIKRLIENKGIDNNKMVSSIYDLIDYDQLIKSRNDFGLVTVRLSGFKPLYVYKEDIKDKKQLIEYLMASCYFPGFKEKKILDNHFYIDGGFYDNSPVIMLKNKGYDEAYVISVKGIGFNRGIPEGINVTEIKPSRDTGLILELNQDVIRDNIKMGYYDTLRVLKRLDGYKYCFKPKSEKYYKFVTRKISSKLVRRTMNFFRTESYKECVIKAFEYVGEQEQISYYKVYSPYQFAKKIKKIKNDKFIYRFIKGIRII